MTRDYKCMLALVLLYTGHPLVLTILIILDVFEVSV